MSAPERIWAWLWTGSRVQGQFQTSPCSGGIEYISATAHAAAVQRAAEEAADAILAELRKRGALVPEGWKAVPDEANMTDEQAEAIAHVGRCCGGIAYDIYRAALAAAPKPAGEG